MRKLAQELGVAIRSLYHYFPTKEDLLRSLYEQVLEELRLPEGGSWPQQLREVAVRFRALCHRHPNVAPYFLKDNGPVAGDMRIFDYTVGLLRQAGVAQGLLLPTCNAIMAALLGYIMGELDGGGSPEATARRLDFASSHPQVYPNFQGLSGQRLPTADEQFEVFLNLVQQGILALGGVQTPE